YLRLVSLGCALLNPIDTDFRKLWIKTYPGLFNNGVPESQIPESLKVLDAPTRSSLIRPCVRNVENMQVDALRESLIPDLAAKAGVPDLAGELGQLFAQGLMSEEDVV